MSIKPSSNVFAIRPMSSLPVVRFPAAFQSRLSPPAPEVVWHPHSRRMPVGKKARRWQSVGGHLLGKQAMEALQAQRETIAPDEEMRLAGLCVDGGATMLPTTSGIRTGYHHHGDGTRAASMFDPASLGPANWRGSA
jgi:hypothetical protein